MGKEKLKVLLEVLNNVSVKYPEAAQYIKENMTETCKREKLSVEEVFCFVDF